MREDEGRIRLFMRLIIAFTGELVSGLDTLLLKEKMKSGQ